MMAELSNDWTIYEAAHLLNRAGFGGTPSAIEDFHQMGRHGAVDWLLEAKEKNPVSPPAWTKEERGDRLAELRQDRAQFAGLSVKEREEMRRKLQRERQQEYRKQNRSLTGWWVNRMIQTDAPLVEKMALFWHDHFPSSSQKVRVPQFLYQQNALFRKEALGNFGRLTHAIAEDPAMMIYLDSSQSSKKKPNENFARELMELFTLGEGHYTEEDIKGAARAFTGYRVDRLTGKVSFQQRQWDEGEKTILGQTGPFKGQDVVKLLLGNPRCGHYLAEKIWEFFAYENPEPELLSRLGNGFFKVGYELKPLLRKIFLSEEFYSLRAMHSQIKSPLSFLAMMYRQLELGSVPEAVVFQVLQQLGQLPFLPPNVAGWDWGRAWVNTNTLLTRYHFAGLVTGAGGDPKMVMSGQMANNAKASAFLGRALQRGMTRPDFEKLAPREEREDIPKLVRNLGFRLFGAPLSEKDRVAFESYAKAKKGVVFTNTEVAELMHLMMSTPTYQLT
ncbi:DUF1800 domain-containing protein [Roseibacillus persicicus]|uniref:DUF1800 domain-containing protein n=1 Tax=Roseibacillus persicicus TaxID=454148 RepID=UPI00398B435B